MAPLFNNFNINLIDGPTAVALLIFIATGGGTLAAIRRNWLLARQADPEAVELAVTHAVERSVAPGSTGDAENTVATEDTGAVEDTGAAAGGVTLGVGHDEEALQNTGSGDDAGTLEVCETVADGFALGVEADGVALVGDVCGTVEDAVTLGVDAST